VLKWPRYITNGINLIEVRHPQLSNSDFQWMVHRWVLVHYGPPFTPSSNSLNRLFGFIYPIATCVYVLLHMVKDVMKHHLIHPSIHAIIHSSCHGLFTPRGVYLPSWVYSHGQLYVAISRVTSSANIKIFSSQGPHGYMQNVVYKEVLEM